uniref:Paired amphipathic helix protein pst1 n=1 Tax=Lygus hesperus TaxID=30085 RepID=A0A0A9Y9R7_LYGHE
MSPSPKKDKNRNKHGRRYKKRQRPLPRRKPFAQRQLLSFEEPDVVQPSSDELHSSVPNLKMLAPAKTSLIFPVGPPMPQTSAPTLMPQHCPTPTQPPPPSQAPTTVTTSQDLNGVLHHVISQSARGNTSTLHDGYEFQDLSFALPITSDSDVTQSTRSTNDVEREMIQGQLQITGRKICYFVMYTKEEPNILVKIINRDDKFWDEKMAPKLESFFFNILLPELVDPRFTRSLPIRDPNQHPEDESNESDGNN